MVPRPLQKLGGDSPLWPHPACSTVGMIIHSWICKWQGVNHLSGIYASYPMGFQGEWSIKMSRF